MNKITATSLGLAALFALSGCDSTDLQTRTITGKAIDPYLAGATVCLGDDDQQCLSDETSVTTDENGSYTLTVSGTHFDESHTIIVTGGHDIETDTNFTGSVVALHYDGNTTVNVSPLTTFAYARIKEANATTHQARHAIEANLTTLFQCDVHTDVVAEADHNHTAGLKAALKLARGAELLDANGTLAFYIYAARKHHAGGHLDIDALLRAAAEQAENDADGTGLVEAIDDIIDAINDANGSVHTIAREAHDVTHNAAGHVHNFVHERICEQTGTCENDHNQTRRQTRDTNDQNRTRSHDASDQNRTRSHNPQDTGR